MVCGLPGAELDRFRPAVLGRHHDSAGKLVLPRLLARVRRDPDDAEEQVQHRDEVRVVVSDELWLTEGLLPEIVGVQVCAIPKR